MKILLGTNNPAKIKRYKTLLPHIDFLTPKELGLAVNVQEGSNPAENAYLKAKIYCGAAHMPCLASDDALELDFLPAKEQPGAYVRRVFGRRLTDKELLDYYCGLVRNVDVSKRRGRFILNYCLYLPDETYRTVKQVDEVEFRLPVSNIIIPGYPIASLHYNSQFNKMCSEFTEQERVEFDRQLREKLETLLVDL